MKKFLSVLLVAAMLVTTLVVAIVNVSAANGDWSVYAIKSQYLDGYADVMHDVPGYVYTDEGLKMVNVDKDGNKLWKDSNPYATFQTTDEVCISDGVYLKVRVDEFTYDAGDKWFGFSIWDQQNVELGKQGEAYGYGVETLIRIKGTSETDKENYDAKDPKTWPGAKSSLEWYKDLEEGQRITCKNTTENDALCNYEFVNDKGQSISHKKSDDAATLEAALADFEVVDGKVYPILTLKIEWDDANEGCVVYINDVPAPDEYNSALNRYFADKDYLAYVGFSLQNNTTNGTIGCTILAYGTSEEDATVPVGDDKAEAEVFRNEAAPLAKADTIPNGEAAIILNGLKTESNVAGKPSSVMGNIITVKEDNSVNVKANTNNNANVKYIVDNGTSYAVEDFPIVLVITRNFCTCTYEDKDGDNVPDPECACQEQLNTLALVGDIKQEGSTWSAKSQPLYHFEPFYVGDDYYNYFIFDWSEIEGITGRINGLRIDVANMKGNDAERNSFDICEVLFFRKMEDEAEAYKEAEDYFEAYYEALAGETGDGDGDNTGDNTGDGDGETTITDTDPVETNPAETNPAETNPAETTPEATNPEETTPEETDEVTEAPTAAPENPTEAPTNAPVDGGNTSSGGCGGVVGVGAIAVVAIAAAGLISFKKKED